jgi:gluconate kinase
VLVWFHVRGGLAQRILRERVGRCVVEIHCESLSMSYRECLRECIMSAAITLLAADCVMRLSQWTCRKLNQSAAMSATNR